MYGFCGPITKYRTERCDKMISPAQNNGVWRELIMMFTSYLSARPRFARRGPPRRCSEVHPEQLRLRRRIAEHFT